MNNKTVV